MKMASPRPSAHRRLLPRRSRDVSAPCAQHNDRHGERGGGTTPVGSALALLAAAITPSADHPPVPLSRVHEAVECRRRVGDPSSLLKTMSPRGPARLGALLLLRCLVRAGSALPPGRGGTCSSRGQRRRLLARSWPRCRRDLGQPVAGSTARARGRARYTHSPGQGRVATISRNSTRQHGLPRGNCRLDYTAFPAWRHHRSRSARVRPIAVEGSGISSPTPGRPRPACGRQFGRGSFTHIVAVAWRKGGVSSPMCPSAGAGERTSSETRRGERAVPAEIMDQ